MSFYKFIHFIHRHLTKLYDSVSELKFIDDSQECTVAKGMFARDGEYVEFVKPCHCVGHVRFRSLNK